MDVMVRNTFNFFLVTFFSWLGFIHFIHFLIFFTIPWYTYYTYLVNVVFWCLHVYTEEKTYKLLENNIESRISRRGDHKEMSAWGI